MKFIFEVRIKPGYSAEEYADKWVRASELIQEKAGARGTRLHRKIGDPHVLLAIASWESRATREAEDDRERAARIKRILEEDADKCEITVIGEFEEPEWVVLPPDNGMDPAEIY
jgi:quinol monooxygenase YgiN